jgi:SAM-dependent methyltransferase
MENSTLSSIEAGKLEPYYYANHTRKEMHEFIPLAAKTLLDVGCHAGGFGAGLKQVRDIEVWGIEPNAAAASQSARFLDHVTNGLFDESAELPENYFDVIVFNDVLEHFVDPWEALKFAHQKLARGGCLIVSLPNLLHVDNLLHLVRDRDFRYEEWGVRDKTHLRFFTRISARRMFEECGYAVEIEQGINSRWWKNSLFYRVAFWLFSGLLEETKYIQNAYVLHERKTTEIVEIRSE